jgi:hypothetical protein
MKKMIAFLTAVVFALTLSAAFAQEKAAPQAPPEKALATEKAPAKHKKHSTHKVHKKVKKEAAAPETKAPATK